MAADDGSISKKSACTEVTCNTISWKEKDITKLIWCDYENLTQVLLLLLHIIPIGTFWT